MGRFEELFRLLCARFADCGLHPLHSHKAIKHPLWREIFEEVFERGKLVQTFGEAAVNYSMDRSFGEHFADVFALALQQFVPEKNYFLTQVWSDRYASGMIKLHPFYRQI